MYFCAHFLLLSSNSMFDGDLVMDSVVIKKKLFMVIVSKDGLGPCICAVTS